MQGCHWHAPQTRRYALDRSRLQCHHRSPLLKTQWSFSRLLGAQIRTQGRMIHYFLGVHPIAILGAPTVRGDRNRLECAAYLPFVEPSARSGPFCTVSRKEMSESTPVP